MKNKNNDLFKPRVPLRPVAPSYVVKQVYEPKDEVLDPHEFDVVDEDGPHLWEEREHQ